MKETNIPARYGAATAAAALLAALLAPPGSAAADAPGKITYNRHIQPLLSDRCFRCHGPDSAARKAGLRLDREGDAHRWLDPEAPSAGWVIAPGRPDESEVWRRIVSEDPDERMPPPEAKLSLDPGERALIRRWIEQGAAYEAHWSFLPIGPITPPDPPPGEPGDPDLGPIDRFVRAALAGAGLSPAPEAGRETLIRRLSFDLTGLPPSPEEIDAFLADPAPGAYGRLVERLLAKPAYGERMAAQWLDLARYSDTYGYQVDRDRSVWRWRDWVVRAFNRNLPYDRFITEQLAGDLLPGAGEEQLLATTFNRLHPQKVEGGSVPEEFRVEYVADRTHTVGTALLGLTVECMRCHDHKYDPLTQRDYYQLFAFFNTIDEAGLYSYFTPSVPTPTLLLPGEDGGRRIAAAEAAVAEAEAALEKVAAGGHAGFEHWLANRPEKAEVPGALGRFSFDELEGGKLANAAQPDKPATTGGGNRLVPGREGLGPAVQLTGDDGVDLKLGNFSRNQPFSIALWMKTPEAFERAVVLSRSRAWTDAASRGYELLIADGRLRASLIHFWPGNAISVATAAPVPVDTWVHVGLTYDGSSRAGGLRLYLDGRPAELEVVRDNLYKNITGGGGDNIVIGQRMRDRGFKGGAVDEVHVFDRQLSWMEVAQLWDGESLQKALSARSARLGKKRRQAVYAHYLAAHDEDYRAALAALRAARDARSKAVDGVEEIMVMREMDNPRPSFVLKRGAYDAPGERVSPGTPGALPPMPEGTPKNRLGLARWLTDPKHPLTARVAVNRVWQTLFGQGLVRTPEDFGSQGERPTHPELLDWLAADFIASGWDVKNLVRQIVTSATYRQSSRASLAALAADPANKLLARAPSYRLPAEMLRDNALAASGLLVDKRGGPPARPYEVAVSFKPVGHDKGEGLYRRSLYTYWKRTGPAPVMMVLDASKRDVCTVKRERTTTPLQALVFLNGPQFVEAARILGENALRDHPDDIDALAADVFRRLTSRRPGADEAAVLRRLFQEQLAYFEADPTRAEALLQTGERKRDESLPAPRAAAAALLASALLSHHDCVVKR